MRLESQFVPLWWRALEGAISVVRHRPLVLHQSRYTLSLPDDILFSTFCRRHRGKLRKPDGLAIVQVHNRPYQTLLERNLDYLGIQGHSVLRVKAPQWRHSIKLREMLRFTSDCRDDYVLFCDSDDAILLDDPQKAISLLHENQCEMLVSATNALGAFYKFLPEREQWAKKVAEEQGANKSRAIHLNSGVYVARRQFLIELLTQAMEFVSDNDLDPKTYKVVSRQKGISAFPEYPKGSGSDQQIFRFLHPSFYPRMKIDYSLRLAVRN